MGVDPQPGKGQSRKRASKQACRQAEKARRTAAEPRPKRKKESKKKKKRGREKRAPRGSAWRPPRLQAARPCLAWAAARSRGPGWSRTSPRWPSARSARTHDTQKKGAISAISRRKGKTRAGIMMGNRGANLHKRGRREGGGAVGRQCRSGQSVSLAQGSPAARPGHNSQGKKKGTGNDRRASVRALSRSSLSEAMSSSTAAACLAMRSCCSA